MNDGIISDIDDKDFYAGGCARYFFGFSTDDVKSDITSAVNSLNKTNIAEVLNTGTSHDETRHRLISLFRPNENGNDTKSIVSQFTVQKLVEHAGEKAILFLYGMGATNPAFDGWVFEADFFFQCKRAAELKNKLPLKGEPVLYLNPREFFDFNHDDMLRKAHPLSASCTKPLLKVAEDKLKEDIKSELLKIVNRRCKPTKWNQGGYDGFDVSAGDNTNEISISGHARGVPPAEPQILCGGCAAVHYRRVSCLRYRSLLCFPGRAEDHNLEGDAVRDSVL